MSRLTHFRSSAFARVLAAAGTCAALLAIVSRAESQQCPLIDTRPPTAAGQKPAFTGQYRACKVTSSAQFDVTVVATGLDTPWAVEPLPGGDLLVTEKPGRLRIVSASGVIGEPITGMPAVVARGQGGLPSNRAVSFRSSQEIRASNRPLRPIRAPVSCNATPTCP